MAPNDEPTPEPGAERPQDWALAIETCRVAVERGHLTSVFYARGADYDPMRPVTKPSAPFSWPRGSERATEEARLAHYELLARLRDEGWTATGGAGDWYATELARPLLVPPGHPGDPAAPPESRPKRNPARSAAQPRAAAPRAVGPAPRRAWLGRSRAAAGVGLVAALTLLGWIAAHASAV